MEEIFNEPLDWLDEVMKEHDYEKTAIIPVLQAIQTKYKYLPEPVVQYVSEQMDITLATIFGIATFYAQFSTEPKGKHIVQVCAGTACHVRGAQEIIKRLRKDLNVTAEKNTTEDKFITLECLACIGTCAMAPAVIVDGFVYGHLNPDKMADIIKKLYEEAVE
jgi:NADH-quinone oxidoreductase subunit E